MRRVSLRRVLALIIATGALAPYPARGPASSPAAAQTHPQTQPNGVAPQPEAPRKAIKSYRNKPDPQSVPELIRTLSRQGSLAEPETSGLYVGFLAGVLGSNPDKARGVIAKILPLPFEDQWVVIRAAAYSGLPQTRDILRELLVKLPDRWTFTERYLSGRLPTLDRVKLEPVSPTAMEKMRRAFRLETYFGAQKDAPKQPPEMTFVTHPELIDTCWGLYFATGKDEPLMRIMSLLPWSAERDNVEKLTLGSMTKLTLAANAAHDVRLLKAVKRLRPRQPAAVQPMLREIIEAAETADVARIKKEAIAAVEALRKQGPGSKRDIAMWGQAGELAISLGCLGAAVAGQAQFGLPCVIGGALSTATLRYFAAPE